jgi:aldose 1-epimerase
LGALHAGVDARDDAAMILRLKCDSLHVDLAPQTGGGIAAFMHGETNLMTPAGPQGLCEFPMGPYVNRIADGVFHWRGETIRLPRNTREHAHPIHGVGWLAPWEVVSHDERVAVLRLAHEAQADWPWPGLVLTRIFSLTSNALKVRTEATHTDPRPMPVALGSHPYFPVRDALVRLNSSGLWRTIDDIPKVREPAPILEALRHGAMIGAHVLDNCLDGWDGRAEIIWPTHTLTVETDPPQAFAQVYAPTGRDFFCLEPQSAMPDGIGREGGGYTALNRGDVFGFTASFTVS